MIAAPSWSLDALYSGPADPLLKSDLAKLEEAVKHFGRMEGNVASLSPEEFLSSIKEAEKIYEVATKLGVFGHLSKSVAMDNPELCALDQYINEKLSDIQRDMCFFSLEINQIPNIEPYLQSCPALEYYKPWLDEVRRMQPYQLPLSSEKILQEKSLTSSDAWHKLYSELHASLVYDFRGKKLPYAEVASNLMEKDPALRKDAAQAISQALSTQTLVFTHVINNIAKDKATDDRLRGFKRPISARNLSNNIPDEIVDTLISKVSASYKETMHRYYALKAKMLNKTHLEYWDRSAPLLEYDQPDYTWQEAETMCLEAYARFSPRMGAMCEQIFRDKVIDGPVRSHKESGAFCCKSIPGMTPYILTNFQGKTRDVYTLAHEVGHALHYMLASNNSMFLYDAPLTFAETASLFGERLLLKYMMEENKDKKAQASLLAEAVENMLNSAMRQIAFCEFEIQVHDRRAQAELSSQELQIIWMEIQSKSFGDSIKPSEDYGNYWSAIPHFIQAPFYVYAYAFGMCLVNTLYANYMAEGTSFVPRYEKMLSMGAAISTEVMKRDFGFDLNQGAFWQSGVDVVINMIDELENLLKELGYIKIG